MSDDKTRIVSANPVGPGVQLNGMYEIDERIAFGGMGEVYRGHNIQTGDPVAIKIVLPEFARDESILALFRKEASILNHLSHDAIVRYHVFSIDPAVGRPYLAMEFVDGVSVADRMAERPFNLREARKLLQRVSAGLAVAHEAGVIHRDISPDNIILPGGNVNKSKIIDFGIARSASVGGGTLLGGKFAGKYNFVSPEQLGLFGGEVTDRSDLYSLALVIAGALRGEAFDMSGSQVEVIEKRRTVPDLAGIDDSLRPLLEAMLQPDPRNRPESAEDIVEWLRATTERSLPPAGNMPSLPPANFPGGFARPQSGPPGYGVSQVPFPGSVPPSYPQGQYPASQPPQGYPPQGSMPPQHSQPPATSQHPYGYPHSVPPAPTGAPYGGSAPMPGPHSVAPAQPGLPPMASSGPANVLPPRQPARPETAQGSSSSRTPLIAAAAVAILAIGGAGAYFGGLFGGGTGGQVSDAPVLTPKAEETEGSGQTASSETPAPTPTPVPATPPDRAEWLAAYDGGACFRVVSSGAGDAAPLDVLAGEQSAIDKLVADYQSAFGSAPTVNGQIVSQPQCPVIDFMKQVVQQESARPGLELAAARLKYGSTMSGTVDAGADKVVNLLLVDDEGVVYDLAPFYRDGRFGIRLVDPNASDSAPRPPLPQVIVAFSSPNGIESAKVTRPIRAADAFPKFLADLKAAGPDAGMAVRFFTLEK